MEFTKKFLVDGMLGSLARKLRILGYDVEFDKESDDEELLRMATDSSRILVTSDINLYLRAKKIRLTTTLVSARTDKEQLFQVLYGAGIHQIEAGFSPRCSVCNGVLVDSGESTRIGKKVYLCTVCGKKYWQGSHWRKLESLFMDVNRILSDFKDKDAT